MVESSPIKYPVTTDGAGRPGHLGRATRCRACAAWTSGATWVSKRLRHVWATSALDQGALPRKRLRPESVTRASTWRSKAESVWASWQSSKASRTISKYLRWGLLKQAWKDAANWRRRGSMHIIGTRIAYLRGLRRC